MQSNIEGFGSAVSHLPRSAIVFYTSGKETSFATHHEVRKHGHGFNLGPATNLTSENLFQLVESVSKGLKQIVEILPANVLVANDQLLVWWMPASTHYMTFDVSMHETEGKKRLQGVSGFVPVPALVFALQRSRAQGGAFQGLSIHALGENARPAVDTRMYRAPLLNINDSGDVCWGNGETPKGRTAEEISAWQQFFFSSTFTHYNGTPPIKCEDTYAFVADLIDTKATEFPIDALKETKQTLKNVVSNMLGGQ